MNFIEDFIVERFRTLRNKYLRSKMKVAHARLAASAQDQYPLFLKLQKKFIDKYTRLKQLNFDEFTTPLWKKFNSRLEKSLLPYPQFSFLQDPTIMWSMFATSGGEWLNKELAFLENKIENNQLKHLLKEDFVGDPLIFNSRYLTSHTYIHHLYHLVKFMDKTNVNLDKLNTIAEWGGGYGSLVRILKKIKKKDSTYIMIDTPLLCCLQWIYLSTIFGEKKVNLLLSKKDKIIKNKVNIVSVCLLKDLEIKADLFISTWALSESSKYSQDYVAKSDWFKAKHLLLAYQENPAGLFDPARVGRLAVKKGATIQNIEFLTGNYYAFL